MQEIITEQESGGASVRNWAISADAADVAVIYFLEK